MKQFVLYFRVSTRRQGDSGLGLDAQRRDINLYLETYAEVPFEVLAEFTDVKSGRDDERPELWKAIELAERTGATLVVAKLDRVSACAPGGGVNPTVARAEWSPCVAQAKPARFSGRPWMFSGRVELQNRPTDQGDHP